MVICDVCLAFLAIPPAQFKLVLDSVIWGFKHTMRNVADTGLSILYQMLQNVAQMDNAAQSFYQTYYTDILQHIFSVVTDSSHSAGWIYHIHNNNLRVAQLYVCEAECLNCMTSDVRTLIYKRL